MWTAILVFVLLTIFVISYSVAGVGFSKLFGKDESKIKQYLIGLFWPIVIAYMLLLFCLSVVIGFFLVTGLVFVVIFNIIRSLIKGEKIEWDKPIF